MSLICLLLLLASDICQLSSDLLLIDRVQVIVQLFGAVVDEEFSLVTMSAHTTKELNELSSVTSTHLDVEQQCLMLVGGSEVCASCNSSVADDRPLTRLQILGPIHHLVIVWLLHQEV